MTRFEPYAPHVLSILRIITALLFIAHGTSKLFGWPMAGMQPPLMSLGGLAAVMELVGGILLTIGLFSRIVAFILSGEMAVAYFLAHAPKSFFPIVNQGELAILFCFIFLYVAAAGPGIWSVDAMRERSSRLSERR